MSIVFIFLIGMMVVISLADKRSKAQPAVIIVDHRMFRTTPAFTVGSVLIIGILTALYAVFW